MIYNFEDLRPVSNYPKYPPYVETDNGYIETYFYNYYLKNKNKFDVKDKTLIPAWWTTLQVDNTKLPVQEYIDVLPRNLRWFAVSQHDDGIPWRLPDGTVHFSAGGLQPRGIPIPLICSSIPNSPIEKIEDSYLFSFVGSVTHPIRKIIYDRYYDHTSKTIYLSTPKTWSQTVIPEHFENFKKITHASKFALAPRGYGLSSFRLYEIMQLGAIPVYISDKHWLPWADELEWNKFCVLLKPDQIPDLYNILNNISEERIQQMKRKIKEIYPKYFTLEGMCDNILKRI